MEQLSQEHHNCEPILKGNKEAETTWCPPAPGTHATTGETTTARSWHATAREEPQLLCSQRKAQHSQKYIKLFFKKQYYPQVLFAFLNLPSIEEKKRSSWWHFQESALPIRIPFERQWRPTRRNVWKAAMCTQTVLQSPHTAYPVSFVAQWDVPTVFSITIILVDQNRQMHLLVSL